MPTTLPACLFMTQLGHSRSGRRRGLARTMGRSGLPHDHGDRMPTRKGPESAGETLLVPKMGAERMRGYGSPTSSRDNELSIRTGEQP